MSHSVSGIRPGSPSQSKSNDSLFAFHMHFPNIHIWTTCFHLFFWFSNRGVRCCSHSLQAGECFGIATAEEGHATNPKACNCTSFITTKPTPWPSMHAFASSSRLSGAFSGSRAADRAGSVAGMTSSHTTQLQRQAVCPTFQTTAFWGIYLFTHEQ